MGRLADLQFRLLGSRWRYERIARFLRDNSESLLYRRLIVVDQPMVDAFADLVLAKMLFLADQSATAPVTLLIDSPGAQIPSGMAIHDTMRNLGTPFHTHCYGFSGSFSTLVMAHGVKGARSGDPESVYSLSPVESTDPNPALGRELLYAQMLVVDKLASDTGHPTHRIDSHMTGDVMLDVDMAKKYGIVDRIVPTYELLSRWMYG